MRAQGSTRSRMLREVLEALDAVCAAAPLVLVLEDLHWADDSTLDLVAALLRRREPARLLLLGTFRARGRAGRSPRSAHELVVRGLCEELAVGRLPPAAVAAHLALRFPSAPLPDGLADVLARRSGGNPLFMRNLVEHWLAEGTLAERSGAVELTRPRGGARGGRAADAARAHPRPARPAARATTPSCSPRRASPGATSPSTRSRPRSSATATRSRRAARSSPGARA